MVVSLGSSGNLVGFFGNLIGSGLLVNNGKVSIGIGSIGINGGLF